MSASVKETDLVRRRILAAADRLLAGTPLRSTGRLSVSQLAIEAGVARWHLTHQHLDLKEQFQARVKNAEHTPAAFTRRLSEFENLKAVHAKLVTHCTELEERLQVYATVINVLSLEKEAANRTARVADIHAPRLRDR
jgi:hypothetical protein